MCSRFEIHPGQLQFQQLMAMRSGSCAQLEVQTGEVCPSHSVLIERRSIDREESVKDISFAGHVLDENSLPASHTLDVSTWGLVLPQFSNRIINARAETVRSKPLFAQSFETRRCIVPCTAYFEWERVHKQKMRIRRSEQPADLQALLGIVVSRAAHVQPQAKEELCLFDVRSYSEAEPESFLVILTGQAQWGLEKIHHRMPFLCNYQDARTWLDLSADEAHSALMRGNPGQCAQQLFESSPVI